MSKIKKSLLAFSFLIAAATILSAFSPLVTPVAHAALTPAEIKSCYDRYNGKKSSEVGIVLENQCFVQKACEFSSNDLNAVVECQTPPADTTNENIENAKLAPVLKLVCGNPPASNSSVRVFETYNACASPARTAYNTCANNAADSNLSGDAFADAVAKCAAPKFSQISGANKVSAADVKAAISQGLADGEEAATPKTKEACEATGGTWEDNKCTPKEESAEPVCSGGPLGWILCPLADLAVNITNFFAKFIENLMTFSPLLSSDQGKAIQTVWQLIVNIANILLVIAFLMVVFSQATSIGLSSYGIKKMLPKIIAAAILMNLSFFICALGVDIANILGQSVAAIINTGINALPDPPAGIASEVREGSSAGRNALVIGITALTGAGLVVTGQIFAVLPILAAAATAIVTAFAVIIFRQVAIVILIILSPLAFVAWILPNTESWFSRWRKLFTALLLMFPLIMGIFYGAAFLSNIIMITFDPSKSDIEDGQWAVQILALAVLVLPLFALPFVMKLAGGILERFGAWTNNRQKGLIDRTRNKSNEWRDRNPYQRTKKERKAERERMRVRDFSKKMSADSAGGSFRRGLYGGIPITKNQRLARQEAFAGIYDEAREDIAKQTERKRGRATDAGAFTASSEYALRNKQNGKMEQVDKDTWMHRMYTDENAEGTVKSLDGTTTSFKASDSSFNSAIASQAAKSGDKAMYGKLLDTAIDMKNSSDAATRKRGEELEFKLRDFGVNNAGVVSSGHPDVIKGSYSAFKSINADGLLGMDGSAVRRMGEYLSSGENVYKDLRVGAEAKVREEFRAAGRNASDAEIAKEASSRLGRTVDSNGKVTYTADGTIGAYLSTAQNAFKEAVVQLNTKDIYSGKAVEGGDLDKAVKDAGANMGMNASVVKNGKVVYDGGNVRFGPQGVKAAPAASTSQQQASQTTTVNLQPGESMSSGGIVIPRGATVTPPPPTGPAAAAAATATPPTPPPAPSGPSPVQQQRQQGGNFGGFNNPPSGPPTPPTPPPTPPSNPPGNP